VLEQFIEMGVPASLVIRRDRFLSPQFIWLQKCLDQSLRPSDKLVFRAMAGAANRIAGTELDAAIIAAEAESSGQSYLESWALAAKKCDNDISRRLADYTLRIISSRSSWSQVVAEAIAWLPSTSVALEGIVSDADEDRTAWEIATRAIRAERGNNPDLDEFLLGIALRPKEPPLDPNAVRLMTIHSSKGLEFDNVWLIGMAEAILPSWQSLKRDAKPAELEEERRNCFVAITRTKRKLVISYARNYRGWQRQHSRFLTEMGVSPS
jgi:DNA helicase-2/ATP-dependent DNA helicase PcrA